MQFLGDADDVCPISFVPVRELAHPVGFDAHRAFECDSVTEWITQHRPTNPVTTLPVVGGPRVVDVLFPLVVEGNDAHVGATRIKLSDAGRVLLLDKKERLRRALGPLVAHLLLFSLAAYALGPSYPYVMLLAVAASWVLLAYQTHATYPRDGKHILLLLLLWFGSLMLLIGSIYSSSVSCFGRIVPIAHSLVLSLRVLLDVHQVAGYVQ